MIIPTISAVIGTGIVFAIGAVAGVYANEKGLVTWDEVSQVGVSAATMTSSRIKRFRGKQPLSGATEMPPAPPMQ